MDPEAIRQAKVRLAKAGQAVHRIAAATSYAEIDSAWSDFLTHSAAIHNKLEQGAKATGKSQSWYGTIKHQRKKDELLAYLQHARNTDEHGLDPTNKTISKSFEFTMMMPNGKTFALTLNLDLQGASTLSEPELALTPDTDNPSRVTGPPKVRWHITMLPVTNRKYGGTFNPPTEHLGEPFSDVNPQTLAEAGLVYIQRIVAYAVTLVPSGMILG